MQSKVLGSRYELLEQIGMGGMAIVYKAMDKMLNRYVAIKVLREEFKENEEFIRRFNVESQAAASLSHQNIVQIYDVGEEDGLHYIVMELLEGETLKQYITSRGGKLTVREATNFSMQICRALEHAHSKHVVHRDIKPQNIIITESGKLKVADFGIARAANNSTMVNAGKNAIGSAHYLSPEQARGGYTDLRSDIYSLGVVMYEMFTGSLPFDGEESISVVLQHLQEEATLLDMHDFIIEMLRYDQCMASFFTADERWERLQEYTYMDMGDAMGDGGTGLPKPMNKARLCDILHHLHDRLIYVFDPFTQRAYYIELIEAKEPQKGMTYPRLQFAHAATPDQYDPEASEDSGSIFDEIMGEFNDFDGDDNYDDEY